MSTRCVVTVFEDDESYAIYRHSDGYPDGEHGVIAMLERVLPFAWPLPRFEAADFAAAIVVAWKGGGGDIYLTPRADNHGDLAYRYEIRRSEHDSHLLVTVLTVDSADVWKVASTHFLPEAGPLGKLALTHKPKRARKAA
jgi:hypothetical protein